MVKALIFTGSLAPGSLLVQLFTGSIWSHVAVELSSGEVIDASLERGVAKRPFKRSRLSWLKRVDLVGITLHSERIFAARALVAQVGKPYDIPWLFDYVFAKSGEWQSPTAWVCSELVWLAFPFLRVKAPNRIAPKHLLRAVIRKGVHGETRDAMLLLGRKPAAMLPV